MGPRLSLFGHFVHVAGKVRESLDLFILGRVIAVIGSELLGKGGHSPGLVKVKESLLLPFQNPTH